MPISDAQHFAGQSAVVTGASSGIGRAIAVALARAGADVCLVGRDAAALHATAAACPAERRTLRVAMDLAAAGAVERLVERARSAFGHVDLLIHSAGLITPGMVESSPVEEFDRHYRLNVRVPYELTQRLLPDIRRRPGQIVFINSSVGLAAKAGLSQYAASKHALRALADSLRQEVNGYGVRVLSIFVGQTATPMQAALHRWDDRDYAPESLLQPEDVAGAVLQSLSLPPTAEATDVQVRPMTKPIPSPA